MEEIMQFYIDSKNGIPIYIQLKNQIKQRIASGSLQPGDKLPTVRELAVKLTINPNTVAKVYKQLENEGLIETKRGVGTYIAERPDNSGIIPEKELDQALDKLITKAFQLGVKPEVLQKRFNKKIDEWVSGNNNKLEGEDNNGISN